MFNTIRNKFLAGFSIIMAIIAINAGYNLFIFTKSQSHMMHVKNVAIASFKYASEMKNDLVKMSQHLTVGNILKNTSSLKKVEEHAILFKKNLDQLARLNPESQKELSILAKDFEQFFQSAKEMITAGNNQIVENNLISEAIYEKVDAIQMKSRSYMDEDLMTIQMHMAMNLKAGIIIALLTIILAVIIAVKLSNNITKPLQNLMEIFENLGKGEGDLTARINISSRDELGKMAQAFNKYLDSLETMVVRIKSNSEVVSHSSEVLSIGGSRTYEEIAQINRHMSQVTGDTQEISNSLDQITRGISQIAQAAEATAIDAQDICDKAGVINRLAEESGQFASTATQEMQQIENVSSYTIEVAEKLGRQAEQIGKIIDTIKSITKQTNLLALNASIEASRAGEHGQGFGVVAVEIKKLAESNNHSVIIIEELVKNIQQIIRETVQTTNMTGTNIQQGTKAVERVYEQLKLIIEGVNHINDRIQNIAASTEEQSASTEELSATMDAINQNNVRIAAAVQEVAVNLSSQAGIISGLSSTATELNQSAGQLSGLVNKFKLHDN